MIFHRILYIQNHDHIHEIWQGPEHCHIDFCKRLARCTNNQDVFLCIMRWHVRAGHLQYLRSLDVDAVDGEDGDGYAASLEGFQVNKGLNNNALPCELGIRYPTLQGIMSGKRNIQTTLVLYYAIYVYDIAYYIIYDILMYYICRDRHMA